LQIKESDTELRLQLELAALRKENARLRKALLDAVCDIEEAQIAHEDDWRHELTKARESILSALKEGEC